ncbi:enoyl-CoA hydratase [Rhodococcus opacus]|nr:enoyl-CoA hydratase [Rhodococcus opacus]
MAAKSNAADSVRVDCADRVMTITINRQNAVDSTVAEALARAVDELDARDDLSVAILTGPGTFCAGMDLIDFLHGESPSIPGRGFAGGGVTESPPEHPSIAAVEGWAVVGGCELALVADIVVAARSAKFGLPEVKRGLVAVGGRLLRLPRNLPHSVAMCMALTGDPITAEEAERHGLVTTLAEDGQALANAREIALRIARNGPLAVRATKLSSPNSRSGTTGKLSMLSESSPIRRSIPVTLRKARGHSPRRGTRFGPEPDIGTARPSTLYNPFLQKESV